jgi:putative transposase
MPRKRHKPEEIVANLRRVDVLVSQGQSVANAVRAIGVTEVTYYRWRQEFGGLKTDQIKRMKELEGNYPRPVGIVCWGRNQAMVWRMVWKDPAPARRAVSTVLRTAVSYSAAHMAR